MWKQAIKDFTDPATAAVPGAPMKRTAADALQIELGVEQFAVFRRASSDLCRGDMTAEAYHQKVYHGDLNLGGRCPDLYKKVVMELPIVEIKASLVRLLEVESEPSPAADSSNAEDESEPSPAADSSNAADPHDPTPPTPNVDLIF